MSNLFVPPKRYYPLKYKESTKDLTSYTTDGLFFITKEQIKPLTVCPYICLLKDYLIG